VEGAGGGQETKEQRASERHFWHGWGEREMPMKFLFFVFFLAFLLFLVL
jgi:hypothetical protein